MNYIHYKLQHDILRQKLMSGNGQNQLGILLMKLCNHLTLDNMLKPPSVIYFGSHGDPLYSWLSNFNRSIIMLDGLTWTTVEHYFQAMKFTDPEFREQIRDSNTPMQAKRLGQSRHVSFRSDWESVKEEVMMKAIREKFTYYEQFTHKLLDTGDDIIVEHTKWDKYWGDGPDGSGKNRLGILLMQLRNELRT